MTRSACPLLVVSFFVLGCSESGDVSTSADSAGIRPRVNIAVVPVQRSNLSAIIELVGNVLPRRRTIIVAEVDGVIAYIPEPKNKPITVEFEGRKTTLPLDIGSEVAKGDLLLKLNASDYERSLKVAEAQLEKLKADLTELLAWQRPEEVARTRALYEEAQANLQCAEPEYQRVKVLHESNAISQSEYEEKRSELQRARALLAHAKANLDIAQAGPTTEQIAVAKAALAAAEAEVNHKRWKVEKTSIPAPYDAVVTDRYVDVGDRVTALPRVEIMELMDISFLVAEVGVPEKYSGKVQNHDRARVRIQGVVDPVPGLVVRINDKVDRSSRTFRIRIAINNDQRLFRVGQFARAYLNVATSQRALTIPRKAVTYAGGQPQVFIYADGQVVLKAISPGIANEGFVEVLSGLHEGQMVVVEDPAVLTDGMRVELRTESTTRVSRRVSLQ